MKPVAHIETAKPMPILSLVLSALKIAQSYGLTRMKDSERL
jgi:hypothetical protein